jgi:hypothetical protein
MSISETTAAGTRAHCTARCDTVSGSKIERVARPPAGIVDSPLPF